MSDDLRISYQPFGNNGSATVTVALGDELLAVEKLDLLREHKRGNFADRLCAKHSSVKRELVEQALLDAAASVAQDQQHARADDGFHELDVSAIARPERIIHPAVSALAVPSMTTVADKVTGRYQLYTRWADGRRERRFLTPALDLPDGGRLLIHPMPPEPNPSTPTGWSARSRKAWLAGEAEAKAGDLFRRLCERVTYFLDLPAIHAPGTTATLSIWAILSYCYHVFGAVPYLFVGGPLGSGKSRVFEVLSRIVFRPIVSSSLTGPTLFRTQHASGGVMLIDEAERLRNTQAPEVGELVAALLAGYKRGGQATRLEPVGDGGFRVVAFDVYGPKALACIAGLPPALASRCIPITMFRAPRGSEKPRRRIDADPAGWQELRDDLHVMALEHGADWLELSRRSDVCPAALSGRDHELWQPLLAIAAWLESHGAAGLLRLMQDHAAEVCDSGQDDQVPDADEALLRALGRLRAGGEFPTAAALLAAAQQDDPAEFRLWKPKGVSSALRKYGLRTVKTDGRRLFRTNLEDLRRLESTYGFSLGLPE